MSWRDRAVKVDKAPAQQPAEPKVSSWKDRAVSVGDQTPSIEGFIDKYGEEYIRPILQAIGLGGGAIGGGAFGTLAGGIGAVPAGVAGAGFGYAAAEQVYDVIKQLLGSGKAKTLPEELQETITDIGTGGLAEITGQGTGKLIQKGAETVKPYIKKGIERIGKSIYGVPEKATKTILERPKEVIAAADKDFLTSGRELINKINKAKSDIITPATENLNRELELATSQGKKVDIDKIIKTLEQGKANLGIPKTSEEVSNMAQIERQIELLNKYKKSVSESKMKDIFVKDIERAKTMLDIMPAGKYEPYQKDGKTYYNYIVDETLPPKKIELYNPLTKETESFGDIQAAQKRLKEINNVLIPKHPISSRLNQKGQYGSYYGSSGDINFRVSNHPYGVKSIKSEDGDVLSEGFLGSMEDYKKQKINDVTFYLKKNNDSDFDIIFKNTTPKNILKKFQKMEDGFVNSVLKTPSKISPIEANELKRSLQRASKYNTDIGMTIRRGANDPVGQAIKNTAREARISVEDVAPGVKQYNKAIERVNKATESKKTANMLKEENIESTLRNLQNETGNKSIAREQMGRIDKILGTDILPTTENIYASKYMKKPDLLSAMPTGRSILPIILGGAGGYASGGGSGVAEGALLAAALASPTTYRYAMPQVARMLNLPASQLAGYGIRTALINKGE
jgi:guanyl-specific ribonuclease Sa